MQRPSFQELVISKWNEKKFLCIGLDPVFDNLPERIRKTKDIAAALFDFNKAIINKVADIVCAFKPNSAFYELHGTDGWKALNETIAYIRSEHPSIPVIIDAKRGDIGNTNSAYAKAVFDLQGGDAVTMSPYLGEEALASFFERKDKGILILVKTSNPGAEEFQNLLVDDPTFGKLPLYQIISKHIAHTWNKNNNCGVVVGATYPEELAQVRAIVGDVPILIPGVGSQGGDLEETLKNGKDSKGQGMIINASRSVLYASSGDDFDEKARIKAVELHNTINSLLNG